MATRLGLEVGNLLRQGREEALAELVVADARAMRPLLGRLWDPDPLIRRRAAGAIGRAAAAHSELGLETVRRLMWALNDESATNGAYGIPALGEIGRRSPEMMAPFVPALVSMAGDDGLRLELLKGLGAIAEADPRLVEPHLARLGDCVDDSQEDERQAYERLVEHVRRRRGDAN